jgi:hypothetical protein
MEYCAPHLLFILLLFIVFEEQFSKQLVELVKYLQFHLLLLLVDLFIK